MAADIPHAETSHAEKSHPKVARCEALYLDARDLSDRREINSARGETDSDLDDRAAAAIEAAVNAIDGLTIAPDESDRRAVAVMRAWATTDASTPMGGAEAGAYRPDESWAATAERGFDALSARIEIGYAVAQSTVTVDDVTLTRLAVLERLGTEPDAAHRRRLFYALDPVWQSIDADGSLASSPYQRLLPLSAARWAAGASPVQRNATALGLATTLPTTTLPTSAMPTSAMPAFDMDAYLVSILETWRDTHGGNGTDTQPWDWWYVCGEAARALQRAAPLHRITQINNAFYASLGADPDDLGVGFDVFPRPGRPLVPVAYTDFGGRPRRHEDSKHDERRQRAKAWVMGTYTAGGLTELTELVHETGHAIHLAAIDTRPALADWPDSDAFTEALAEVTGMDTAEPAWQEHWLGVSVAEAVSLRGRYADIMLDVCWALLEIRLHDDPEQVPNDVWTDLTSTYLGIAPHPELSWWAMRGQLVQEPGYMVNYALGPIITADLRATIRAARGDWSTGDLGWYGWVADRIYRWGLERSCGDVLTDVLGRPLHTDALLHDISRGRR